MSGPPDLDDLANLIPGGGFLGADPFADAGLEEATAAEEDANDGVVKGKTYVHVRVQQRNGRKSLTTVQGIDASVDYNKVLKALKKTFCCNGTVVEDPEQGHVIQLQGDQRKNVSTFLVTEGIVKKESIKVHGV